MSIHTIVYVDFQTVGSLPDLQKILHCKPWVVMMPTLSPLQAPQVVVTTTCAANSADKVGIMTILGFTVYNNNITSTMTVIPFQFCAACPIEYIHGSIVNMLYL